METSVEQALRIALEHHQAGRLAEAEQLYAQVLKARPDHPEALHLAGVVSHQRGDSGLAVRLIEDAIRHRGSDPTYLNNLGEAYRNLGQPAQAAGCYRAALSMSPGLPEVHNNLGLALADLGAVEEAEQSYRRALSLNPRYAKAHSNLGAWLLARGRLEEAEAAVRAALDIEPQYAEAHSNLGAVLLALGRPGEAEASYRRALQLNPQLPAAHSAIIFLLDFREGCGVEAQQAERRRWYEANARRLGESIAPHENTADPRRRLRIGYVSADFRRHSAYYLFGPIIRNHDRSRFEVFCYSGVQREDDATARMREAAHAWRVTVGMSDDALAEQIRRDGIDILVDLSGHSARNRLLVFARKPAPVQVTAWGHGTGTGLRTMDYFFADPVYVPPAQRAWFAEAVVDLPCCLCYEPPEYLPDVAPLPALRRGAFTFGCLNRIEKVSDGSLALWARIIAAVPGATLLIKSSGLEDPAARSMLLARLANAGLPADRMRLVGASPHAEHLATFSEVDVALDPFPHGGGVSTVEALWMGVPVVALEGSTPPSRLSQSILTAAKFPEWIARDADDYVRIALRAAGNPQGLAELRAGLRSRLERSPVGDARAYCRAVESAFGAMWRRWCIGAALERHRAGDFAQAEKIYAAILQVDPQNADALHLAGVITHQRGDSQLAAGLIRQAIDSDPSRPEFYGNLSLALSKLGRFPEMEEALRTLLTLQPQSAEKHCELAYAMCMQGRLEDAERAYRHALQLQPGFVGALCDLGFVLSKSGRHEEAEKCEREALALRPDLSEAHNNLGVALRGLGRLTEAAESFRHAAGLKASPDAWSNLGAALRDLGRLQEAESAFREALRHDPGHAEGHSNLGVVLKQLGRLEEAEASYRRALELKPDFSSAHSNLIMLMDFRPDCDTAAQQAERQRWYAQHGRKFAGEIAPHRNSPEPRRRLRIGYVSADFRRHSAYYAFSPVICDHDRTRFEVFCYSDTAHEDDATARIRSSVDGWRTVRGRSHEQLAAQIRADGIDILVDLAGHSAGNRLLVFARKPAPIQVTAWGHATGTGLATMDYLFSDKTLVPESERGLFAEKIVDLPCFLCYEPPDYLPEVSPLPALADRRFTFGCVNRLEKITEITARVWGQLLGQVRDSTLLVKAAALDDPAACERLQERLAGAGIEPGRVRLEGASSHARHLEIYCEIDVALDPFPQNGGISSAECLSMGVPIVALLGSTVVGRSSAAILEATGLGDWIAASESEYVAIAANAARSPSSLARLRKGLRQKVRRSRFGDPDRYRKAVEKAYRAMWREWCASRTPG